MKLLARMILLLLFVCSVADAQLIFKQEKLSFTAKSSDGELNAEFVFENQGESPVTIEAVKASCGCTAATPDKKTYAPGESGTIAAKFTFGERSGRQNKTIKVTTVSPNSVKYNLELEVDILKSITLQPNLLRWDIGGELKTQRMIVKLLDPETMKFEVPDENTEVFTIKVVDNEIPDEIWLDVTPKSLTKKIVDRTKLFAKSGSDTMDSQTAYFLIR